MTVDLSTTYLGLELRGPLVPSASPATGDLDSLARLEEAGASAVVLPSLFEEQIEHESMAVHHSLEVGAHSFPEATSGYFPEMDDYNTGPSQYLDLLSAATDELTIPVIASLNGDSLGGWTRYARILEDSGAAAIELNVYLVEPDLEATAASVERRYLELVEQVRSVTSIPLAVKVGPFFSAMGSMARRLVEAGADGLVLFNRLYHPDIDLDEVEVVSDLRLSTEIEMRLVLQWVALLYGRLETSLAATGGVHGASEALKLILGGADVVMMASALLRHGPQHLGVVLEGVEEWLEENGYHSVAQARGSLSQQACPEASVFERVTYMKTLTNYGHP